MGVRRVAQGGSSGWLGEKVSSKRKAPVLYGGLFCRDMGAPQPPLPQRPSRGEPVQP